MSRILAIVAKEFRQIVRDRLSLGLLIVFPALLLVLYGYALSFDVRHLRVAVLDRDRTPESRQLLDRLFQNPYFDRVSELDREGDIAGILDRGRALVGRSAAGCGELCPLDREKDRLQGGAGLDIAGA